MKAKRSNWSLRTKHPKLITGYHQPSTCHESSRWPIMQSRIAMTSRDCSWFQRLWYLSHFQRHLTWNPLDECHQFAQMKEMKSFRSLFVVSSRLKWSPHRHPAHEGDPASGSISACGEIDEKLQFPNWQGRDPLSPRLCLLCLPTKEEQEQLDAFSQQRMLCSKLTSDLPSLPIPPKLPSLIGSDQRWWIAQWFPGISLLPWIFLRSKGIAFPKTFPPDLLEPKTTFFTLDWLEILLQGLLFSSHWYNLPEEYESNLHELKQLV